MYTRSQMKKLDIDKRNLTWIHISDIHFGHSKGARHRIDQKITCEEILKDAKKMFDQVGPPDFIFLTGDIAFKAHREQEYSLATEWIKKLLINVQCSEQRLYVVPGNHDVDRDKVKGNYTFKKIHETLRANPAEIDELLSTDSGRDLIWPKLNNYAEFAASYAAPKLTREKLFWVCNNHTQLGEVYIVGLNTNLLSFDDKDSNINLALGIGQIEETIHKLPVDALLIVLQHHPPHWLTDGPKLVSMLQEHAHILFFGHIHEIGGLVSAPLHGNAYVHLIAGAGHNDPHSPAEHSYSWGRLNTKGLVYYPRIWNKTNHRFTPDQNSFSDMQKDGSVIIPRNKLPKVLGSWLSPTIGPAKKASKLEHLSLPHPIKSSAGTEEIYRKLASISRAAIEWVMSAKVHWAPTINSTDKKVANTAEGLLCILNSLEKLNPLQKQVIDSAVEYILKQIEKNGLKSLSLNNYTVHCTAMGLFVLQQIRKLGLYPFKASHIKKIDLLKESLISSASSNGWGFINSRVTSEKHVRFFSTFWALRALATTDFVNDAIFARILSNLINRVPGQRFGYSFNDTNKVSIISLFLTLLSELKETPLGKDLLKTVDVEKLIPFLLEELSKNNLAEVEEYIYPLKGPEKLSWIHISGALALEAVSLHVNCLNNTQRTKFARLFIQTIINVWHERGYFYDNRIPFDTSDQKIFPTVYYIAAIRAFIKISSSKGAQRNFR